MLALGSSTFAPYSNLAQQYRKNDHTNKTWNDLRMDIESNIANNTTETSRDPDVQMRQRERTSRDWRRSPSRFEQPSPLENRSSRTLYDAYHYDSRKRASEHPTNLQDVRAAIPTSHATTPTQLFYPCTNCNGDHRATECDSLKCFTCLATFPTAALRQAHFMRWNTTSVTNVLPPSSIHSPTVQAKIHQPQTLRIPATPPHTNSLYHVPSQGITSQSPTNPTPTTHLPSSPTATRKTRLTPPTQTTFHLSSARTRTVSPTSRPPSTYPSPSNPHDPFRTITVITSDVTICSGSATHSAVPHIDTYRSLTSAPPTTTPILLRLTPTTPTTITPDTGPTAAQAARRYAIPHHRNDIRRTTRRLGTIPT